MVGFVSPMCLDGYATFYSITNDMYVYLHTSSIFHMVLFFLNIINFDRVHLNVAAFRESEKTSAHRFADCFQNNMFEVGDLIDRVVSSKL